MPDNDEFHRKSAVMSVATRELRQFVMDVLGKKSVFERDATIVADCWIAADLAGTPELGTRLLPDTIEAINTASIDPRAQILTLCETPAVALLDGSTGLGPVAATRAIELAIEKARQVGTGTIVVKNSRPVGNLAIYARKLAEAGLIGQIVTAGGPAKHGLTDDSKPIASAGRVARSLPICNGSPLIVRNTLAPPHTGLAFILDMLTGPLSGRKPPILKKRDPQIEGDEHFIYAIDPEQLIGRETFDKRMSMVMKELEDADRQRLQPAESTAETIELSAEHQAELEAIGKSVGVSLPWA